MHFLHLAKELPAFFSPEEVAACLKITKASARVLCSRYNKKGYFMRLKRNIYLFKEALPSLTQDQIFQLSIRLQEPSYISFTTALHFHGVLPSVPSLVECVSPTRSNEKQIGFITLKYHKLPKSLYFGFEKSKNILIATPEKALLDLLYMMSFGRAFVELKKINIEAMNIEKLLELAQKFPIKTQRLVAKLAQL